MSIPGGSPAPHSVAVIGAGVAGAVTAYRLRQLLDAQTRIVVLEREPHVGGRARDLRFGGAVVEVGGTLIHSSNRRLTDLIDATELTRTRPDLQLDGSAETLAIWDGTSLVLWSKTSSVALAWALLRRYGPLPLVRMRREAVRTRSAWTTVYARQDAGDIFATPADLLGAIGLRDHAHVALRDLLIGAGVRGRLTAELVDGILRNMYNQTSAINALAGAVALIGGGFAGGSLFSVAGGNAGLVARTLDLAGADVRLNAAVAAIRRAADDRAYEVVDVTGGRTVVDAVVLATPLELADISLAGLALTDPPTHRRFQTVHTTLVAGDLSHAFFGAPAARTLPSHVLTTNAPDQPFKSIGITGWSPAHRCRIYKIFSADRITDDLLEVMFAPAHEVYRMSWQAYPVLSPAPTWTPFRLEERLYYINAFESAVSTMETEAVAAWNVAALIHKDLRNDS